MRALKRVFETVMVIIGIIMIVVSFLKPISNISYALAGFSIMMFSFFELGADNE